MVGGREKGSGSPDIGRHDERPTESGLVDEPGQEPTHGARGEQVFSAFGSAEAREVDGEEPGVRTEGRPEGREGVQALWPRAAEHDCRLRGAAAVRVSDPHSVDVAEADVGKRCRGHGFTVPAPSG
jgi:hypothetical protein